MREGLVELRLKEDPRLDRKLGPQRAGGRMVFYNPAAKTSRDLTVVLMRAMEAPAGGWRMLDGLCGSGVRGLRVAFEVEHIAEVVLNDGEEQAAAVAEAQALRLAAPCVRVTHRSLEETLADPSRRFDFIDLDPYGSPAKFLTAAAARTQAGGAVAATATDVAALCGVFPAACLRRYGARPLRNEWMKETAARILLGAAARKAGAAERAIEPVATLSAEHYIRVVYRVRKGAAAADKAAAKLGFLKVDASGVDRPAEVFLGAMKDDEPGLSRKGPLAGPMWLGDLHDPAVLARAALPPWMEGNAALARFLELAPGEVGLPPYHFLLDEAASRLRGSPPPTRAAVERLQELGFRAARTHFDRKGVKTTASPAEFLEALRPLISRG